MHRDLQQFINSLQLTLDRANNDEEIILQETGEHMKKLVSKDSWLPSEYAQPHPEYYQQYLLYCCPEDRFSIVSFVWGPGQKTPLHDHTVWGVIGMLRGSELEEEYELGQEGLPATKVSSSILREGDIGKVSPTIGDIHLVANASSSQVSVSIHVYGADIGKVQRHVYDPKTSVAKGFISGYANA